MRSSTAPLSALGWPLLCALLCLLAVNQASADPPPDAAEADTKERAQAHFEAAMVAYQHDELAVAKREMLAAYALLPSPELAFNLGRVCERLGNANAAATWFQRYLADDTLSPHERRDARRRVKAARARIQEERAQTELLPPSPETLRSAAREFFERGVRLFKRGKFTAARLAFGAAYRMSGAPELLFNLALTAERMGHYDEAVTHLRSYLREFPAADHEALEAHIAELQRRTDG